MRRPSPRHALALLIALMLVVGAGSPSPASAADAPSWSLPLAITTQSPFADSGTLSAIACADVDDCYVGSAGPSSSGEIYRSTDGGTEWSAARPAGGAGGPFACAPDAGASTAFCLALSGDQVENLSAVGAPVTGPAAADESLREAAALACPSSQLCVAAGSQGPDGEISTSTRPRTGTWKSVDVDSGNPLIAVTCPDVGLCVAVDTAGGVVVSSDPANGAWTRTQVGMGLDAVSCSSDQLCVAVSADGQAYVSTDPVGGDWTQASVPGASDLVGVSCADANFCAVTDTGGAVFTATTPADGNFSQVVSLTAGLGPLDCPVLDTCLAIDGSDAVSASTVLSDDTAWKTVPVDAWTPLAALACPSATLCVALQQDGRADSTTTPLNPTTAWTIGPADPGQSPVGLDCPATTACFGIDAGGGLLSSGAPARGSWHRITLDAKGTPVAISCAGRSFCAMVDSAGYVFTSADPGGGAGAWKAVRLEVPRRLRGQRVTLTAVTCPSTRFCLVTDGDGRVFTSRDPRGAVSSWTRNQVWYPRLLGDYSLAAAACPTATDCTLMATDTGWLKPAQADPDALGSYALTSTDPTGDADHWKIRQIDGGYVTAPGTDRGGVATGLSCPTTRLCAMVDDLGTAVTNTGAASGRWLSASIDAQATPGYADGSPGLTGVACFSGGHCVAVDGFGNRFVFGVGAGPVAPAYTLRYDDAPPAQAETSTPIRSSALSDPGVSRASTASSAAIATSS